MLKSDAIQRESQYFEDHSDEDDQYFPSYKEPNRRNKLQDGDRDQENFDDDEAPPKRSKVSKNSEKYDEAEDKKRMPKKIAPKI